MTGVAEYISGCSQALVVPTIDEKGVMRQGEWFDVQRLIPVDDSCVVLENVASPGPDQSPLRWF